MTAQIIQAKWRPRMNWSLPRLMNKRGQSLVEYSLVIALVVIVCIAALTLLGTSASTKVNTIATQLSQ